MYLSLLAQMEDKYPPLTDRQQALHRRTVIRSRRAGSRRGLLARARVAPHFWRGRPAAEAEPC